MAIVVHNLDAPGGMERQAARLAESLAARGIEVTVVTTRIGKGPRSERRGALEIIRVPVFAGWPEKAVDRLLDVVTVWALMRRRERIDAIYGVQFTGGSHAALAAYVTHRPAVVKYACSGEHGDFHALAQREDADRIREALRGMERHVIISDEIQREAAAMGLDPARFVRIRNGVDTKRFSPEGAMAELPELGPASDRRVVLFTGRLDAQKRVDVLLRAFAKVHAAVPEARLALAGAGPRLDEYHRLARELGIVEEIAFLGPRTDVDALQRAASVFVLPSASEGLPNALLEALACGTPSVATAIPGTMDVVRHEREALLVPLDDEEALAAAITRLLRDRELCQRLAAAGRERIAAEFDMERVADQYVALFSGLPRPTHEGVAPEARFASVLARNVASLLLTVGRVELRDSITALVVAAKRRLGIEGEILARWGPGTAEPARATRG